MPHKQQRDETVLILWASYREELGSMSTQALKENIARANVVPLLQSLYAYELTRRTGSTARTPRSSAEHRAPFETEP